MVRTLRHAHPRVTVPPLAIKRVRLAARTGIQGVRTVWRPLFLFIALIVPSAYEVNVANRIPGPCEIVRQGL